MPAAGIACKLQVVGRLNSIEIQELSGVHAVVVEIVQPRDTKDEAMWFVTSGSDELAHHVGLARAGPVGVKGPVVVDPCSHVVAMHAGRFDINTLLQEPRSIVSGDISVFIRLDDQVVDSPAIGEPPVIPG